NLGRPAGAGSPEQTRKRARIEGPGRDAVGTAQREDLVGGVDRERGAVPFDPTDGADTAQRVEELGRGVDLERTHGQDELKGETIGGEVTDLVAGDQSGLRARARRERRHTELPPG